MAYEIVETKLNPSDYEVDPNAPELKQVKFEENGAINDLENIYWGTDGKSGLIGGADKYYNDLAENAQNWGDKQSQLQQERTDFTIEQIEQQKAQAKKDYTKEQSGAYVDWQKQSNQYGANAEAMAAQGLANTGYSESSQVSMYNTYQNRVTAARDSYNQAVLNYNNAIKDAQLSNNAALAEIAYNTLQKTLELSLEGFQYKNQLISELADKKLETKKYYSSLWQSVWNSLLEAEKVALETDKFNADLAEEQRQAKADADYKNAALEAEIAHNAALLAEEQRQFNENLAWQEEQASKSQSSTITKSTKSSSKSSGGSSSSKKASAKEVKASSSVKSNRSNQGTESAKAYLNALIASGASKDKVSNEISLALRNGAITAKEAQQLRSVFTPRGLQY